MLFGVFTDADDLLSGAAAGLGPGNRARTLHPAMGTTAMVSVRSVMRGGKGEGRRWTWTRTRHEECSSTANGYLISCGVTEVCSALSSPGPAHPAPPRDAAGCCDGVGTLSGSRAADGRPSAVGQIFRGLPAVGRRTSLRLPERRCTRPTAGRKKARSLLIGPFNLRVPGLAMKWIRDWSARTLPDPPA